MADTKYQIQQNTSSGLIDIHPVTKAEYVIEDTNHKFISDAKLKTIDTLSQNAITEIVSKEGENEYISVSYETDGSGVSAELRIEYSDEAGKAYEDGDGNNIADTYATTDYVDAQVSEVTAIANGKTKTYVISYDKYSYSNKNNYEFESNDPFVTIASPTGKYFTNTEGKKFLFSDLHVGDILIILEIDVPDRYLATIHDNGGMEFARMETAKVDLSSYVNTLSGTANNGVITGLTKSGSTLTVSSTNLTVNSSTTASGTATTFVSNVTQAANGKITVTKTAMPTYNNYSLPTATSSALGGIKVGYTTSGKNYKIQLDNSGNAYVNVPWTDNNTTYGVAKYNYLGLVKPAYTSTNAATLTTAAATNTETPTIAAKTTTAGRYYGVEADKNGYMYVNVPWSDTNTKYSAGTGLDLNGTQFNLSNSGVTAGTYSAVAVDAYGRATSGGQVVEVGAAGQTIASSSLVVGGLFFKKVN